MTDGLDIAIEFHQTYERMAVDRGFVTRDDTKVFEPDSPNGRLMIAVCHEVGCKIRKESENRIKDLEDHLERLKDGIQVYRKVIKSLSPLAFGSQHLIDIWEETTGQKLMPEQNYSHAPRNIYVDTENLKQEF